MTDKSKELRTHSPVIHPASPNLGQDQSVTRRSVACVRVRTTVLVTVLLSVLLSLLPSTSAYPAPTLRGWCRDNAASLPYATLIAETFDYVSVDMRMLSCCESRGIPTMKNAGSSAVGLFQIMRSVWGKYAAANGYDLLTAEGNIAVAVYVLQVQGLRAWQASRSCWA